MRIDLVKACCIASYWRPRVTAPGLNSPVNVIMNASALGCHVAGYCHGAGERSGPAAGLGNPAGHGGIPVDYRVPVDREGWRIYRGRRTGIDFHSLGLYQHVGGVKLHGQRGMNPDARGAELDILRRRPIEHAAQVHAVGKAVLAMAPRIALLARGLYLGDITGGEDGDPNVPFLRVNDYTIGAALQPEIGQVVNGDVRRRVALAVKLVDQRRDVDITHGGQAAGIGARLNADKRRRLHLGKRLLHHEGHTIKFAKRGL